MFSLRITFIALLRPASSHISAISEKSINCFNGNLFLECPTHKYISEPRISIDLAGDLPSREILSRSTMISSLLSMSVALVGPYHGDSYGGGGTHNAAVGWQGLRIGDYQAGRAAPWRIDRNGTPIGWAPTNSLRLKVGVVRVGLVVIVGG
jgi:hypothetical protein